jgi:hypothetical protein
MSNETEKMAVEWFANKIDYIIPFVSDEHAKYFNSLIEQAKEMEKRQIVDAWSNGFDEDDRATSNPFKYFNETYGGKK